MKGARFGQEGGELSYGSYLRVPELLALQSLRSAPPAHDELLFIVVHQAYELWFKVMLFELESVRDRLFAGAAKGARHSQNGAVIVLDVARFVGMPYFHAEVARLVQAIKSLPPQPGAEILLPGERGDRAAEKRRREGIPLPAAVYEELGALMERPS